VDQIKKKALPREELEMIKANLKGTILLSSDSVEARMSSIAKNDLFLGNYVTPDEVCRMIDEVRPEDVRRVARRLLSDGSRSILALGPKPSRTVWSRLQPELPKRYAR
jgi:predicted Zn-dependent peptidase